MNSLASRNITQEVNEKIVFSSNSSSSNNMDLIKSAESFLESFLHNDVSLTINLFSHDCAWYFPGNLFFKTAYKGINEIRTLLENIYEMFPRGLSVTSESLFSDKKNFLQIRWKSSAVLDTGEYYYNNGFMNITFNEGGLIIKIEEYLDTAKLCKLFNQGG